MGSTPPQASGWAREETLRRVYSELGLGRFRGGAVERAVRAYAASVKGYKKNEHRQLDPALEAVVRRRWADAIAAHGYE